MRVVVIGIDGGTWSILKPMVESFELPNIRKIMDNGIWGVLDSTFPPVTGPAWVSFATGKNPGKHGVFDFVRVNEDRLDLVKSYEVKEPAIHDMLSKYGYRCIVISLPLSFPPKRGFRGIMISDFLYPGGLSVYPPSKVDYIQNYKLIPEMNKEKDELLDEIVETAKIKIENAKRVFMNEDWHFFFFHFHESDYLFHNFWKDVSTNGLRWKKGKKVFMLIDEFIGWVTEKLEDKGIIFVVSDHGFSDCPYVFRVNKFLEELDLLETKYEYSESLTNPFDEQVRRLLTSRNLRVFEVDLPNFIIDFITNNAVLKGIIKKALKIFKREFRSRKIKLIDFKKSKAFVPTPESMGIYISNVDNEQRKELIELIKNKLYGLEFNGYKVIEKIWMREEIFNGPNTILAPDVLLYSSKFRILSSVKGRLFGIFEEGGYHDPYGIFIAYGKSLKKGKMIKASIYDVMPTILSIFNIPIPNDVDGKVLDIFE